MDAYDRLLGTLTGYHHNRVILVDGSTNWAIYSALCQNPNFTVQMGEDPIQAMKGVKERRRDQKT